jgi:hypothetical protein
MGTTQTWKDTIGCTAILVTIVVGSLTGLVAIYNDVFPVAALAIALID